MSTSRFGRLGTVATMCAAVVGLTLSHQPVLAAEKEWRMHQVFVATRPEAQGVLRFVDIVNEKASDEISITLYSGGSLGLQDADMLRVLPRGTAVQATALYPGYLSRDRPEYADTLPPGVVVDHNLGVSLNPILEEIYRDTYAAVGVELLSLLGHGTRDLYVMCREPVTSLEELRTKRLRVWEQSLVDLFSELGVAAQIIGQNDLYMALQTGVVDCTLYTVGLASTISLHEVAPYASYMFPYVLQPITLIVSKQAFEDLSAETQEIMREAARTVEEESFAAYLSGEFDVAGQELFEAGGGEILEEFSEDDRQAIVEVARSKWAERIGRSSSSAQANYDLINAHLKRSAAE